jgi:hypothetical protein
MSKNLNDVLSTTQEFTLGEDKFVVKPISLGMIANFQAWCDVQKKKEIIEVYRLAEQVPDVKEIMEITGDEAYYESMMNSISGIVHLLYKVIHKSNKTDITEEQISERLDTENLQGIVEVIFGRFLDETIETPEKKSKNVKAKPRLQK